VLATRPGVAVVARDSRYPGAVLRNPVLTGLIDLGRPVCVVLASVLHFPMAD
jgi:hypothetical protein